MVDDNGFRIYIGYGCYLDIFVININLSKFTVHKNHSSI